MSDKGTFPRQDTLGFCLLELAAICGEFPASLIPRIPGSSSYKEAVITLLKKERLLRVFYKDRLRGFRLGRRAKGRLLAENPERFSFYLTEKDAAAPDSGDLCRHAERRSRSFP